MPVTDPRVMVYHLTEEPSSVTYLGRFPAPWAIYLLGLSPMPGADLRFAWLLEDRSRGLDEVGRVVDHEVPRLPLSISRVVPLDGGLLFEPPLGTRNDAAAGGLDRRYHRVHHWVKTLLDDIRTAPATKEALSQLGIAIDGAHSLGAVELRGSPDTGLLGWSCVARRAADILDGAIRAVTRIPEIPEGNSVELHDRTGCVEWLKRIIWPGYCGRQERVDQLAEGVGQEADRGPDRQHRNMRVGVDFAQGEAQSKVSTTIRPVE